jgi:hypothetical protein
MPDRLLAGVLGHRNSGKSHTWNTLFGRTVRRGVYARTLELRPGESVEVFLVSGSFEEREEYAGDILKNQDCRIVLCSMQYILESGVNRSGRSNANSLQPQPRLSEPREHGFRCKLHEETRYVSLTKPCSGRDI